MSYIQKRKQYKIIITTLIFILFTAILFSFTQGSAEIPPSTITNIILDKILTTIDIYLNKIGISSGFAELTHVNSLSDEIIILEVRLPRILLAALVGASLSISGVVLQGLFRNPMADPYILGISSGAGLGAAIAMLFGLSFSFIGISGISTFAFFGGIIAILIVYNIAKVNQTLPTQTLLLSGIAVSAFFSACIACLMFISGDKLHGILFWLFGSMSSASWSDIKLILPYFIICATIIYIFSRDLNVMLLGEEDAKTLGIDTEILKKILLFCATMITAAAVSVSGLIGFVGLVIPHITRIIVGPDHKILIPASVLIGSIVLVVTDTLARTIIAPADIPVGIITALFGAPFFIYLLKKKKHEYF